MSQYKHTPYSAAPSKQLSSPKQIANHASNPSIMPPHLPFLSTEQKRKENLVLGTMYPKASYEYNTLYHKPEHQDCQRKPWTDYEWMQVSYDVEKRIKARNKIQCARKKQKHRQRTALAMQLAFRWAYSSNPKHFTYPNPWNRRWKTHYMATHPNNPTPWLQHHKAASTSML
jgi:hypothetical protein